MEAEELRVDLNLSDLQRELKQVGYNVTKAVTEIKFDMKEMRKEISQLVNLFAMMQLPASSSPENRCTGAAVTEEELRSLFLLPLDSDESLSKMEEKLKRNENDRKNLVR